MLHVTKNIKEVTLHCFYALAANSYTGSLKAFQSHTKRLELFSTKVLGRSPAFLHPDTTASFESIAVRGRSLTQMYPDTTATRLFESIVVSRLSSLANIKLFWRQLMQVSKQTLSTIILSESDYYLSPMSIAAANQDLENIKTLKLSFMTLREGRSVIDSLSEMIGPLRFLASSRSGSRLKRLEMTGFQQHFLPPESAQAFASFDNLEDLTIIYDNVAEGNCDPFIREYLSLAQPSLRKIELERTELSATSFRLLFSNKTLESIKLVACWERDFFSAYNKPCVSKLCSLDILSWEAYDTEHILMLLAVLPNLRCLKIDEVKIMDPQDVEIIVGGISKHQKLCIFECFESTRGNLSRELTLEWNQKPTREKSPNKWLNGVLRLACLRNRCNASEKRLPLGVIPIVITRSAELCGESGIFQFLKEEYPSYMGASNP